jgi:hypothetical protein
MQNVKDGAEFNIAAEIKPTGTNQDTMSSPLLAYKIPGAANPNSFCVIPHDIKFTRTSQTCHSSHAGREHHL